MSIPTIGIVVSALGARLEYLTQCRRSIREGE